MIPPLYICGPTASGKTSIALAKAKELNGEIINGDAFQVYRGLEILSAAPSSEELAQVPHHLYGICDLVETMDAARYHQLATPLIAEIGARGKKPIIVGGSGLYLKFMTHGPAEAPPGDAKLRSELDQLDLSEILRQLKERDPEEWENQTKQNAGNRRHLSRALEICILTEGKASDLRRNFKHDPSHLEGLVLTWDREKLTERIAQRTCQMLSSGAIEEVRNLPQNATTACQAIGVREIKAHLNGELTHEECLEKITTATRRYAKRQENWFRRETWLKEVPQG